MRLFINILFVLGLIAIAISTYLTFGDIMFEENYQFTGNVTTLTGTLTESIITGNIPGRFPETDSGETEGISNIDLYKLYVSNGNVIIYTPQHQPSGKSATYESNTTILNQYLAKNTKYIDVARFPGLKQGGFLYVRTKKEPKEGIFMYWHNAYGPCGQPVSGKLVQSNQYKISDNEFLYPLNGIELIAYYSKKNCIFNWQDQIKERKNQYIGGYVASTNGNTIEEISIAWE